jgi:hypothetical protein
VAGRPQRRAKLAAAGAFVETATPERRHGEGCECRRCSGLRGAIDGVPFEPRNDAHLLHGATSERQIRPVARNHRRRLMRQIGLRVSEIDPIGRAYLEHYCRLTAKIVLLDAWVDEHGLIRDDGSLQPCMTVYATLTNSATRTLAKLAEHLRVEERDPATVLAALRAL